MPSLEGPCGSTVNYATGNLYHSQTLFSLPNSKFMGEFGLSYTSLSSQNDVLGMGWTHTYNIRLAANNDGSYTLTEGDGRKTVLYSKGSYYSPQNWNFPALTVGTGTYTIQHKDGIRELRVFQLLPKGGNHTANEPRIGHANAESARMLLGSIPVESDGSA